MAEGWPEPMIRINPARRRLDVGGVLGAGLLTGADKLRNGFRNGDSLLIDLKNRVFAVADAGERFPQASRHLLERLAQDLDDHGPPADGPDWQARIAALWKTQLFVEKTTLSIVAVRPRADGCRLWITHGGDSRIAIVGMKDGGICHRSRPDMNFAGRSIAPPAPQSLTLEDPAVRIVLATDGLNDLFKPLDDPRRPSLPPLLRCRSVDAGMDAVYQLLKTEARPYDDAGLIVVDLPLMEQPPPVQVLIGARTQRRAADDAQGPPDAWIDPYARPETIEELAAAGIRLRAPARAAKEMQR